MIKSISLITLVSINLSGLYAQIGYWIQPVEDSTAVNSIPFRRIGEIVFNDEDTTYYVQLGDLSNGFNGFEPVLVGGSEISIDGMPILDTHSSLLSSNLPNGSIVKTKGFKEIGDGGGGEYIIVDDLEGNNVDNAFYTLLNSGNYAKLIIENGIIDIRKLGAIPNDGVLDRLPMERLSNYIKNSCGFSVVFPEGEYLIGEQVHDGNASTGSYYELPNIVIDSVKNLKLEGYGAVLKFQDGLKVGAWDRFTPNVPILPVHNHPGEHTSVGTAIEIKESSNVKIEGFEIDGNCNNFVYGGLLSGFNVYSSGQRGIRIHNTGVRMISISNVSIYYTILDAMSIIGNSDEDYSKSDVNQISINNVHCYNNARMGLTLGGGFNVLVSNSVFEKSGIDTPVAAVNAGVDIESGGGGGGSTTNKYQNLHFENCTFGVNLGDAVTGGGYTEGYQKISFNNCKFWGGTRASGGSYSLNWDTQGGRFTNCEFHGRVLNRGTFTDVRNKVKFLYCSFDDQEHIDYPHPKTGTYLVGESTHGVEYNGCTFKTDRYKLAVFQVNSNNIDTMPKIYNCEFETSLDLDSLSDNDFVAIFRDVVLKNNVFRLTGDNPPNRFYLNRTNNINKGGNYILSDNLSWEFSVLNNGLLLDTDNGTFSEESYSVSVPISGEWEKGQRVYNSDPDSGEFSYWICTASGTSGTWVGMDLIP